MNNEIRLQGGGKPVTTGFATPQVHRNEESDQAVNDSLGSADPAHAKDDQETGSKGVEGANKETRN